MVTKTMLIESGESGVLQNSRVPKIPSHIEPLPPGISERCRAAHEPLSSEAASPMRGERHEAHAWHSQTMPGSALCLLEV